MKKKLILILMLFIALSSGAVGVLGAINYLQCRNHEARALRMRDQLRIAAQTPDPATAVALYNKISPMPPAAHLGILQRRWRMALDKLIQIQRVKYNPVLEKTLPSRYQALMAHLTATQAQCAGLHTEFPELSHEIAWQAHNIKAAVLLLKAFTVLETEQNWKKVRGTLKEAVHELKSAIHRVDRADATPTERLIPRWNMELIQGKQAVKKIFLTRNQAERRLDLKENLEAIIPEKGGYAPGDPLERRMKK